ncbi:MAG: 1-acyl-sn-glycerol-3-phosphate acyltransferase [Bacteroidales bacterium]|nr:1-acyl-sn-glycerol-3-phosphate acyltransferase [Bacteroidales bacterium]
MSCKSKICKGLLRMMGWKTEGQAITDPQCIFLGAPHTTIWDFVVSYLFYGALDGKAYCMVKSTFFFPPLGWILKAMGGIPVTQKNRAVFVRQIIKAFQDNPKLQLAIAPEGTRARTDKWKTGFHLIAKTVHVPVYLAYFDWGTKTVGIGPKLELTDNPEADLKRARQWYKDKGVVGKYPEKFSTGKDLE